MNYRIINGFRVPQIGLGLFLCRGESIQNTLAFSLSCGYSFFDTAYRYDNEKEIGNFLSSNVDSKCPLISSKMSEMQYSGRKRFLYLDKVSVEKALKRSNKLLHKQVADMFMLHSPFSGFQNAFRELLKEQERGHVRIVGVSGFNQDQLIALKRVSGVFPQVCMLEIHPYYHQEDLLSFCKDNNIEVIARSPFAHGLILRELENLCRIIAMKKEYNKRGDGNGFYIYKFRFKI